MKYLYILTIGLCILSCDSKKVYDDFNDLDNAFWPIDSIQNFTFQIDDTLKAYNLYATFRNSSSYPFYNIYFQYSVKDSVENILLQELTEFNFFDPKTGEPLGSGLGDLFDHTFLLEENYRFKSPGEFSLQFQQFMRMDTLPYIVSVGARIESTE